MFKVLGLSDDVTTCDCCGKTNLKKTVVLDNGEATVFYGVDCAATVLRGTKKAKVEIEWIARWISIAHKWLAKGYTIEQVCKGMNDQAVPAEIKNGVLGVWTNRQWQAINN